MTVILDIDQDFFFYPGVAGSEEEVKQIDKSFMEQQYSLEDVLRRYDVNYNTPQRVFESHEEVAIEIIRKNLWDVKLIHLDFHDDIEFDEEKVLHPRDLPHPLGCGNWLNFLLYENRIHSIDWVVPRYHSECGNKNLSIDEEEILLAYFGFDDHTWSGPIDFLFFTRSQNWIPHELNWKKYMRP